MFWEKICHKKLQQTRKRQNSWWCWWLWNSTKTFTSICVGCLLSFLLFFLSKLCSSKFIIANSLRNITYKLHSYFKITRRIMTEKQKFRVTVAKTLPAKCNGLQVLHRCSILPCTVFQCTTRTNINTCSHSCIPPGLCSACKWLKWLLCNPRDVHK